MTEDEARELDRCLEVPPGRFDVDAAVYEAVRLLADDYDGGRDLGDRIQIVGYARSILARCLDELTRERQRQSELERARREGSRS